MHKAFLFLLQRRETVDLHPKKNIHWLPLSLSLSGKHIHWHSHEKARILAYWLSKKEEEEAQLAAATRQLLTHRSLSRIAPRYSRRFTKMAFLTPFTGPTIHCSDLLFVVSSISSSWRGELWGGKLPRMVSMSLSRHYFFLNVFACRRHCDLHTEKELKRPC